MRGYLARLRLPTPTHEGIGDLADAHPHHRALLLLTVVVALVVCHSAEARYPAAWVEAARCIHRYEVGLGAYSGAAAWPLRWADSDNSESRGGLQFLYSTWQHAVERHRLNHYPADPANASRAQQLYAAWLVYLDDSRSWREWSTAAGCGLR